MALQLFYCLYIQINKVFSVFCVVFTHQRLFYSLAAWRYS